LYGSAMGIMSIARGTVPLALFGPSSYPLVMGRLALPSWLAQAIAPLAASLLLERAGASPTLLLLVILAFLNVIVIGVLKLYSGKQSY
jgi:hypothetical protein